MSWQLKMSSRIWRFLRIGLAGAVSLLIVVAVYQSDNITEFLFFHSGIIGLLLCPLPAIYYLWRPQLIAPMSSRTALLALLSLTFISLVLGLSETSLVTDLLGIIHRRFQEPYWQWVGLILAASVYLPLMVQAVRVKWKHRHFADLIVCGTFFAFVFLLFLPFGFNSIGHWEAWGYRAYLEGQHSQNVAYELVTRFWVMVPHLLAMIIGPDSFVGFHLVHLLIFWAKLTLLYGILRKLKVAPLHAFLTTLLFMIYPVNSGLISLRSLPNQFSIMALLAAVYFILDYRVNSSRLRLLGVWLGLVFCVVTNETAYMLILVAPLLWLWNQPRRTRKNFHLIVAWYLFPVSKVAHLLLLSALKHSYYNSYVLADLGNAAAVSIDHIRSVFHQLVDVYRHTFLGGWLDAWHALENGNWLWYSLAMLALVGTVSWYLSRENFVDTPTDSRQARFAIVGGSLFLLPSVGILIWLDQYTGDLWRMYFYVPIGAAIAIMGVLQLLSSPIRSERFRKTATIVLYLVLMLLGTSRLLAQHQASVERADNKARLLMSLMETIPRIGQDTIILLTTDMSEAQFDASDIYELRYSNDLDNSIFYVLYGDGLPVESTFCITADDCSTFGGEDTIFTVASPGDLLQKTLVINIDTEQSVDLVMQPAVRFGLALDEPYDASNLYDADAPLPPRAVTMLGSVMQ